MDLGNHETPVGIYQSMICQKFLLLTTFLFCAPSLPLDSPWPISLQSFASETSSSPSPVLEVVADVADKRRMPMVAANPDVPSVTSIPFSDTVAITCQFRRNHLRRGAPGPADLPYHSAFAYGGRQVILEAILKLGINQDCGTFGADKNGF